jgi:hypothetical protein
VIACHAEPPGGNLKAPLMHSFQPFFFFFLALTVKSSHPTPKKGAKENNDHGWRAGWKVASDVLQPPPKALRLLHREALQLHPLTQTKPPRKRPSGG